MISPEKLAGAFACPLPRAQQWAPHLSLAMERYAIDSPLRQAAFLAQVGHESGRLRYVREIWNPKQCAWQAKYEGRHDLGNTQPGDGERFKGRGLIQITGRANYRDCGAALELDLEASPELLEVPEHAALSAAWYWDTRHLNALADSEAIREITRRINGGFNGLDDRMALYKALKKALDLA